jgi:hypothetical protein
VHIERRGKNLLRAALPLVVCGGWWFWGCAGFAGDIHFQVRFHEKIARSESDKEILIKILKRAEQIVCDACPLVDGKCIVSFIPPAEIGEKLTGL